MMNHVLTRIRALFGDRSAPPEGADLCYDDGWDEALPYAPAFVGEDRAPGGFVAGADLHSLPADPDPEWEELLAWAREPAAPAGALATPHAAADDGEDWEALLARAKRAAPPPTTRPAALARATKPAAPALTPKPAAPALTPKPAAPALTPTAVAAPPAPGIDQDVDDEEWEWQLARAKAIALAAAADSGVFAGGRRAPLPAPAPRSPSLPNGCNPARRSVPAAAPRPATPVTSITVSSLAARLRKIAAAAEAQRPGPQRKRALGQS